MTATSAGTGGAGSSSSSGGCGATDGGTDGSTDTGTEACSPPGSTSPGGVLWSTSLPAPCPTFPFVEWTGCSSPAMLSWAGFEVGSTGTVYAAISGSGPGPSPEPGGQPLPKMWVGLGELDASGALLTDWDGLGSDFVQSQIETPWLSLVGADNWVINGGYSTAYGGFCMEFAVTSRGANSTDDCYGNTVVGYSDLAGDTWLDTAGLNYAGGVWHTWNPPDFHDLGKLDPSGYAQWVVTLPGGATVLGVDPESGTSRITGPVTGTDDLGCGTIAGSGVYAGEIDTCGHCTWSRAAGTAVSIVPAGGRSYLAGTFQGTLDVGCGKMTSTVAMPYAAAIDTSGACVWSRGFPAVKGLTITPLPTGEALITGGHSGSIDVGCGPVAGGGLTAKLDAAGKCVWSGPGVGLPVGLFSTGDIALSAPSTGSVRIARLDGATGSTLWSNSLAVPGSPSVSVSALDYVVAFGAGTVVELDGAGAVRFQSSTAFDQHALDPCGNVVLGALAGTTVTVTKIAP